MIKTSTVHITFVFQTSPWTRKKVFFLKIDKWEIFPHLYSEAGLTSSWHKWLQIWKYGPWSPSNAESTYFSNVFCLDFCWNWNLVEIWTLVTSEYHLLISGFPLMTLIYLNNNKKKQPNRNFTGNNVRVSGVAWVFF